MRTEQEARVINKINNHDQYQQEKYSARLNSLQNMRWKYSQSYLEKIRDFEGLEKNMGPFRVFSGVVTCPNFKIRTPEFSRIPDPIWERSSPDLTQIFPGRTFQTPENTSRISHGF
eukprot:gene24329-1557_t